MSEPLPPSALPTGGLFPYLQLSPATEVADFYVRAFGGKIVAMHPVDDRGRTMHIHLHVNGSSLMLSDNYPEHGHPGAAPAAFTLTLQVDDTDVWIARAVAAGATLVMPAQDMFWGDRYGQIRDPYGVDWAINAPKR